MLSVERRNLILARIRQDKKVFVAPVSEEFQVSEETIRRDLEKLEKDGFVSRVYGGAVVKGDSGLDLPYTVRKRTNVEAKLKIADNIAKLISDGEFVMLDESSTSAFVASAIKSKKNITLITNSIEIIIELSGVSGWNILATGGCLKQDVLALTGHQAENFIRGYHVDTAVISCTGVDMKAGYTDAGEDNALIKRAMIASAGRTILAADCQKFEKKAFASIGGFSKLSALVTDTEPSDEWKALLSENGVDLIY